MPETDSSAKQACQNEAKEQNRVLAEKGPGLVCVDPRSCFHGFAPCALTCIVHKPSRRLHNVFAPDLIPHVLGAALQAALQRETAWAWETFRSGCCTGRLSPRDAQLTNK